MTPLAIFASTRLVHLSAIDFAIIIFYFALVLTIGFVMLSEVFGLLSAGSKKIFQRPGRGSVHRSGVQAGAADIHFSRRYRDKMIEAHGPCLKLGGYSFTAGINAAFAGLERETRFRPCN